MRIVDYIIDTVRGQTVASLKKKGAIIGENVVLDNSIIDKNTACLVEIGNNVYISGALILAHDAVPKRTLGYTKIAKTKIGNNVYIGTGSIVMAGSRIGDNVILGAGTVVNGKIPDNSVFCGNPAKKMCNYDEYIEKHRDQMKDNVYDSLEQVLLKNKVCDLDSFYIKQ